VSGPARRVVCAAVEDAASVVKTYVAFGGLLLGRLQ
jgi:hypothetical protein